MEFQPKHNRRPSDDFQCKEPFTPKQRRRHSEKPGRKKRSEESNPNFRWPKGYRRDARQRAANQVNSSNACWQDAEGTLGKQELAPGFRRLVREGKITQQQAAKRIAVSERTKKLNNRIALVQRQEWAIAEERRVKVEQTKAKHRRVGEDRNSPPLNAERYIEVLRLSGALGGLN